MHQEGLIQYGYVLIKAVGKGEKMKRLSKLTLLLAVPLVALAVATIVSPETASAADDKSSNNKKQSSQSSDYKYVAQTGDSYSLMARKAVQDYSKKNKSNLSQAQIIAAETTLTQAAGSPYLDVGQNVTIKASDVKSAVDAAKKLTDAQKAAWQQYVAGADFDTGGVGQAS